MGIIVAPDSCPSSHCRSHFSHDQLQTITDCIENSGQPGKGAALHPSLKYADFARIGVYGHSMGGAASMKSAEHASHFKISAAVAQHPCYNEPVIPRNIACPVMYTAGTADATCPDGDSKSYYGRTSSKRAGSKILFDVAGAGHMEPTFAWTNSEVPAVAFFLTCHLRGENCDRVYGATGRAICHEIYLGETLRDCWVEVGAGEEVMV